MEILDEDINRFFDAHGKVLNWLDKEEERLWYKNCVNAGRHILSPLIFSEFEKLCKMDLDRDILKPLISDGEIYMYNSSEYIKDMGTPDRFYAVIEAGKNGGCKVAYIRNGSIDNTLCFETLLDCIRGLLNGKL